MMTLLAKGLGWVLGSNLLPAGLSIALLLTGHQLWLARDQRIATAATVKCEAEHELAVAKAERDKARREAAAALESIEQERQVTETLRHDRQAIADEFAAFKANASADPRCLSDGVLDLLRGGGATEGRSKSR